MDDVNFRDLSRYRIEMAERKISAAEVLIKEGMYADAVSRIYYGIFHAARAMLALKGLDSKKHSGIISLFNQHFVKTGLLPKEFGRIIKNAKDLREESDYNEFYLVSIKDAEELLKDGTRFIIGIKKRIQEILNKL
ncbi:HEPN domain-containing protein [Desulfolucanica intricata]|uniref:HEPN domain-containing protein n=1 Tax=Desulfolucanica intricata TaxID=1285191 RepID=UPI000B1EDB8F|nr:HEPN domain-containing protein [Desulfolucanica intricata]